jgi:hypothetical protein
MTKVELHALVEGLPESAVDSAAQILRRLHEGAIDPEQAWFWDPDWLSGEHEADRESREGLGTVYEDAASFEAALAADS